MHEAGYAGDFPVVRELFLEPVLDCLDVVIGTGFDLFYRFTVDLRKIAYHGVKFPYRVG